HRHDARARRPLLRLRPALVGTLAGTAVALISIWACSVDRRSNELACTMQSQCSQGRICAGGYCVEGTLPIDAAPDSPPPDAFVCPAQCNSCDIATKTCMITGAGSGDVTCPVGFHCVIACNVTGACANISCTASQSCDVTCGSD